MFNTLMKSEARHILSKIRYLSGHRMAYYKYEHCRISSLKVSDGVFELTYLFQWEIMPNDETFQFRIKIRTNEELLHRATNYVYDNETAREMRSLYLLLRKAFPIESFFKENLENPHYQELESAVIRVQNYYKYGIMINY